MRKNNKKTPQNTFKTQKAEKKEQLKDDLKGNDFSFTSFFASFKDQRIRKII